MDQEALVEALVLHAPGLAADMAVAGVDLRAWEKLASCLWVDCVATMPGEVSSSPVSPMAKRRAKSGWNFMKPAQASSNRM